VLPFEVDGLDVRGRIVQLGPMIDTILGRHAYPEPVARLLAEAIALTVLLGTSLKFEGKLIIQTKGDGPVDLLVADFSTPGDLRAYARFDEDRLQAAQEAGMTSPAELLGNGVLAFTIDQGAYMQRYQGIVEMNGGSLEAMAETYFRQSEQIPTLVACRWPNCSTAMPRAIRVTAGAPAASWSSSCRKRPTACACPIFRAAMRRKAWRTITTTRTTAGPKPRRWSPPLMRAN
jgi:redox-regulated HSP33 family molecular chaperone